MEEQKNDHCLGRLAVFQEPHVAGFLPSDLQRKQRVHYCIFTFF